MKISKDSDTFLALAAIANRRRKSFTPSRMNLAEFGFALQLAHAVGVSVEGLEDLEASIKKANPHFSGWNLSSTEEYQDNLRFLDEMGVDPDRQFETEWFAAFEEAKEYLASLKA